MKKILLFIVSLMVLVPNIVLADMGAPVVKEYEAEVSNPDGAAIYKYDSNQRKYIATEEKVAYGTKIDVTSEYNGLITFEYNNVIVDIRVEDITPVEKTPKNIELGEKKNALVIRDIEIKKGPAEAYETTGKTIKGNTNIEVRELKDVYTAWVYVEYNGTKGYINSINNDVVFKSKYDSEIMIAKDSKILSIKGSDINLEDGAYKVEEIGSIPAYTIIKNPYEASQWTRAFYITYNNKSGFVYESDVAHKVQHDYLTTAKTKVYKEQDRNSKVVETLEKGYLLKKPYVSYPENCQSRIFYESADKKIKGWIIDDECGESDVRTVKVIDNSEDNNDDTNIATTITTTEKITKDAEDEISDKLELSTKDYIIICLAGGMIVSLTALVTIILVNKKHKKSDNNKEDQSEEKKN